MFVVNEDQKSRHDRIRSFLTESDVAIALLLGCADFEWTIRRAIIGLSSTPNVDVRKRIRNMPIGPVLRTWKQEVTPVTGLVLSEIVDDLDNIYIKGSDLPGYRLSAFGIRNGLIHGNPVGVSLSQGTTSTAAVLAGSVAIAEHAANHGCSLFNARLQVVQSP